MSVRRTGHPLFTVDGVTIADTGQTVTGESDDTAPVSVVDDPILVAEGGQVAASGMGVRAPNWQPANVVGNPGARHQADVLFAPVVQDEADVLDQGGRLNNSFLNYLTTAKASLVAGPAAGKAVDVIAGDGLFPVFHTDGVFPLDEWTIEVPIFSPGADLTAQASASLPLVTIMSPGIGTVASDQIALTRTGTAVIEARYKVGDTTVAFAQILLVAGEVPADTWKVLSLTFKRSQALPLRIYLGNGTRHSGTGAGSAETGPGATAISLYPMTGWGSGPSSAGMAIGGNYGGQRNTIVRLGMPIVRRLAMTPNTPLNVTAPTVTVDAATTQGAMPDTGGMLWQYEGWTPTGHDSSSEPRNQIAAMHGAAGLKRARIEHILDKAIITGTGANPVFDWTPLWEIMDPLADAGVEKFDMTLGYTPSILGATFNTPPSNNAQFAAMCLAWMNAVSARYGAASLGSWSLWNEPDLNNFWNGTTEQLTTLWVAVHDVLEPAFPNVWTGPTEVASWSTAGGSSAKLRDIIDRAATDGRRLDHIRFHDYSGDLGYLRRSIADARAYVLGKAATGEFVPANAARVALTEWNWSLQDYGQYESSTAAISALYEPPSRSEKLAAYAYAAQVEMIDAGCPFTSFTRGGITTAGSPNGAEAHLGAFTINNPPRPLPVFAAFQALWKLQGSTRVSATVNWPSLRALAGKHADDRITVTYGTWKPGSWRDRHPVNFRWQNLPDEFTWKHWQIDRALRDDGRMILVGQGDQTNLPIGASIGTLGVGCVEVTPV